MSDKEKTIAEIRQIINKFSNDRNWTKSENPKNLVMALSVEVAELVEIFQWINSEDVDDIKANPEKFEHLQEEISDVFWYLMRICEYYKIDLYNAVQNKAIKNGIKYPKKNTDDN
jgi:NTP pyrophosphatase (non-canonical NTP hydrolase)